MPLHLVFWLLSAACIVAPIYAHAQQSKPTVRHHRVEEPAENSSPPEVEQAEAAMQRNDFAAAEPLLQKAVAAAPNDYRAWFDLGYVYNALHRPTDAIDAYRKSVAAKPDVFESNLNLGLLLAKQGQNGDAAKYLKAATGLKPAAHPEESMARAWLSLGRVQEPAEPQQAMLAYQQAAKLNPKAPAPHLATAQLLQRQGDLDAAAREYREAAALDPELDPHLGPHSNPDPHFTDALYGLASVYIAQRKYADAEATLRQLLVIAPVNNTARAELGHVLAAEGKNEEAAEELKRSLQAGSSTPTEFELGSLYVKSGNDAEAERWLRQAVHGYDSILKLEEARRHLVPGSRTVANSAEAHLALGSLLLHEKKFPEAQQELLIAVKLKPDLADGYSSLAVAAASNENYQLALQALDIRAKYLPEVPATYFLRATTFDHLKAIPQAVEYYQRFLAVDDGKFPDQEWQARHRLIALDPQHADKYRIKK